MTVDEIAVFALAGQAKRVSGLVRERSPSRVWLGLGYRTKVQVIRSKGRAARLFVNIPMPLVVVLDIQAGERIRWQLLGRSDLRLVRLEAPTPTRGLKK